VGDSTSCRSEATRPILSGDRPPSSPFSFLLLRLDATNLRALARGCRLLAGGAGGDLELGLLMALVAVQARGPVPVVALDALPGDALVVPCGLVGAPQLANERIFSGDEGQVLSRALADLHGAGLGALMCLETAGPNGLVPVTWAARAGVPLVDADGAGRVFPGLQQRAMQVAGVRASPVALTDGRDNVIVIDAADDDWAARLARSTAAALGGVCAAAAYGMSARRARTCVIAGSLSRAVALGHAVDAQKQRVEAAAVAEALGATVLIEGRVTDLQRNSATIDGTAGDSGRQVRVELQSQYLIALEDGAVRAAIPDLIVVLDAETATPIASDAMRRGDRVAVLAAPARDIWRTEQGLAVAGPRAFGYDIEYARG
jgi:uncharacterized protein